MRDALGWSSKEACSVFELHETNQSVRLRRVRSPLTALLENSRPIAEMLSCKQLTELVTDYLEGKLSLGGRLRFQVHLGMCTHCRAYLRQMKLTIETLGALPAEPIPAGVRDALLQRFHGGKH